MSASEVEPAGTRGRIVAHRWEAGEPRFVVLLAQGYGEHARDVAGFLGRHVA